MSPARRVVVAVLRRREPQPAAPAGYAPGDFGARGAAPAEATPAGPGPTVGTPTDNDRARGIAAIRMMDPAFDPAHFTAIATDLFTQLQIGWSAGDLGAVRAHLTDEMAVALENGLARLGTTRRVNRVERVKVESAEVTEVRPKRRQLSAQAAIGGFLSNQGRAFSSWAPSERMVPSSP